MRDAVTYEQVMAAQRSPHDGDDTRERWQTGLKFWRGIDVTVKSVETVVVCGTRYVFVNGVPVAYLDYAPAPMALGPWAFTPWVGMLLTNGAEKFS